MQLENEKFPPKLLSKYGLFKDLEEHTHALEMLSHSFESVTFQNGAKILTEGSPAAEAYLLLEGRVAVVKKTPEGDLYTVTVLESKAFPFFGESSLLANENRSATIIAQIECKCLMLSKKKFEAFSLEHPKWALPILRRIAISLHERLRKTNEDVSLLYHALVSEIRGK